MKTGIVTTSTYQDHFTGQGHPERADRVTAVIEKLKKKSKTYTWLTPNKYDHKYLKFAHGENFIQDVDSSFPKKGLHFLDGDTVISPGSKNASIDAVNSILTAIDVVMSGRLKNIFCAVRPPGHHAEKNKAMGFCVYNNVAVGAYYLLEKYKLKKVAIIDFDVHHGNGTQDIFFNNEKVLYISTHQYPFYPGTGSEKEKGKFDNIFNIPLASGTTSNEYLNAYEHVLKKIKKFKPDFILFSAGFDAHKNDPLANFKLESKDFFEITKRTLDVYKEVNGKKTVSILEGGYELNALAESADQHVKALNEF